MATMLFANNATTTLAGAITNSATVINVASGGGALFPSPTTGQYFVFTIVDAATGLLREIVWCTSRSGDTFSIVRAQEGTTALNWSAGDLVQQLWTAGQAGNLVQSGQSQGFINYCGVDTGTANGLIVTSGAALSLYAGLVLSLKKSGLSNTGATTLCLNSGAIVSLTWADGSALAANDWPANALGIVEYTGSTWALQSVMGPTVFARVSNTVQMIPATTFYVNPLTGVDTNPGTLALPFRTIQGAVNTLSTYQSTSAVTIVMAAGTDPGFTVNASGIASWVFTGAGVGSSQIYAVSTNGGRGAQFNGAITVSITGFSITGAAYENIVATRGALCSLGNISVTMNTAGGGAIASYSGATVQFLVGATVTYTGTGNSFLRTDQSGTFLVGYHDSYTTVSPTFVASGSPSVTTGFATCTNGGNILFDTPYVTFTNALTGPRFAVNTGGGVQTGGAALTYLPGSTAGVVTSATYGWYA